MIVDDAGWSARRFSPLDRPLGVSRKERLKQSPRPQEVRLQCRQKSRWQENLGEHKAAWAPASLASFFGARVPNGIWASRNATAHLPLHQLYNADDVRVEPFLAVGFSAG